MDDAQREASEAARSLAASRWGNQVVQRAAETVIRRADELPAATRALVHLATADQEEAAGE